MGQPEAGGTTPGTFSQYAGPPNAVSMISPDSFYHLCYARVDWLGGRLVVGWPMVAMLSVFSHVVINTLSNHQCCCCSATDHSAPAYPPHRETDFVYLVCKANHEVVSYSVLVHVCHYH